MTVKETRATNLKKVFRDPVRIFEDSGSVNPNEAYYVQLENVTNAKGQDIKTMVDRGRYFSIFAPRQSGKTTFLKRFRQDIEKDFNYVVVLLSFERYSQLNTKTFYSQIQKSLYEQLVERLTLLRCDKLNETKACLDKHNLFDHISFGNLLEDINRIIRLKKIIIFIDEFDGIPQSELGNFLTTLRDLYLKYKEVNEKALYSIGLVGIRNITKLIVGGVSPFNIADQVNLSPFTLKNVRYLYAQYTKETNQPFSDKALKLIYDETGGQPWLVNRLGTILTVNIKPRTIDPIEEADVEQAIRLLLKERNVHFDNLYEKAKLYKETFVEIVFDHVEYNPYDEDQSWLEQYGLIKEREGHAVVTNNIYKSLYIKAFFKEIHADRELLPQEYELPGHRLDMERIIFNFEKYISQIGVSAFHEEKKPYEKTGQFLLTAWLYQLVRGGKGEVRYEVRSGLGRMDILLTYKNKKYIIETKVNRHEDIESTIKEGVTQLSGKYLVSEKTDEGYLVIFDTKTVVGTSLKPSYIEIGREKITCFVIAIGKTT